jgi:hypothetical protein
VLEHREHGHHVVLAAELLDRRVGDVEVELLAGVGERAAAELGPGSGPAAVEREPQEEADRGADVQQVPVAAVGLELVEDLGELLAVELELARRREHVDPEVVRATLAVLVEHERLVDLRVREDEAALVAANDRVPALDEELRVRARIAARAVDVLREALGEHPRVGIEQLLELLLLDGEVPVTARLSVQRAPHGRDLRSRSASSRSNGESTSSESRSSITYARQSPP